MPEPRTKLPKGLPPSLVDFARCKVDTVELGKGKLDWLPKPKGPLIPDIPPELTFEPGPDGSVNISAGWGPIGVTVNASVVDGNITVTTENPLVPQKDLKDFQDGLNADLRANGKAFDKVEIAKGKLKLSKRLLGAPAKATQSATPGAVTPSAPAPKATPPPPMTPGTAPGFKVPAGVQRFTQSWQGKAGITLGALALGTAAFFLFTNDGEPITPSSSSTTTKPPGGTNSEVGALPCDTAPTEGELAAVVGDGGALAGYDTGTWPAVPAVLDPAFHVRCTGFATSGYPEWFAVVFPTGSVMLAGSGEIVVSHAGSVPDAKTGEEGLSKTIWRFLANFSQHPSASSVTSFFEYTCAGKTITGMGMPQDGFVNGDGPLFQYGPCTPSRVYSVIDGTETPHATNPFSDFVVDANQSTLDGIADPWATNPALAPQSLAASLFPAMMVRDTIIGSTADSCVWGVRPDGNALRVTDCYQWGYWTLPAFGADGHPGAIGSGGPQIVASGMGTTDPAASYGDMSHLLFSNTLYHCGPGRLAFTVCAADGSIVPEGPWTLAQVVLDQPVAEQPADTFTVGIGFDLDGDAATGGAFGAGDTGGVEVEYRITATTDGTWTLSRQDGVPTTARALLAETSITLVVPSSELSVPVTGYRTYALLGAVGTALPEVGAPPLSTVRYPLPVVSLPERAGGTATATTVAATTTPAPQTVEAFLEEFNTAVADGDVEFLTGRLHPVVIGLYGEDVCRAFVESDILTLNNYQLTGDLTGPITTTINGEQVDNYFTAPVSFAIDGETFEQQGAFALVDGEVRWFTQCG